MDLLVVALLSLIAVPLALGTDADLPRVALGAPLVLFVPGYVLVAALYPRRGWLGPTEHIALSIGLSVAIIPLLGLALQFGPWGIQPASIVGALAAWAVGGAAAAWLQRRRVAPDERAGLALPAIGDWLRRPQTPGDLAAGGVVLVGVLAVVGYFTWRLLQPVPGEPWTEFYVLGPGGVTDDYPTTLWVGETAEVFAGVVNREGESQTYAVQALLGSGEEVGSAGPVTLQDREAWEGLVTLTASTASGTLPLEFRLIRGADDSSDQTLRLFVNVRER